MKTFDRATDLSQAYQGTVLEDGEIERPMLAMHTGHGKC